MPVKNGKKPKQEDVVQDKSKKPNKKSIKDKEQLNFEKKRESGH